MSVREDHLKLLRAAYGERIVTVEDVSELQLPQAILKLTQYVDEAGPGSFNTSDLTEVRKKVRGLLWLIAPYHDGHQD